MPRVSLAEIAPRFVEMAHNIVWCSVATVDEQSRPRSRILHPLWEWDGEHLVGWVTTEATPIKRAHLEVSPFASCNYWTPSHDTTVAECRAGWANDDETRARIWQAFKDAPEPVGFDPAMIPFWDGPTSPRFAVLRLDPWRIRLMPGEVLLSQTGNVLTWEE
jgi:hypothetical protein